MTRKNLKVIICGRLGGEAALRPTLISNFNITFSNVISTDMNHTFSLSPLRLVAVLCIALTIAAGCGKKSEDMTPVQPGETVTFRDMVYKFSFKAPKSWVAESQPGKQTSYFSTQGAETRFQKQTEGDYGAMIEVGSEEHKTKE